jgi:hypothetical protein
VRRLERDGERVRGGRGRKGNEEEEEEEEGNGFERV